CWRSCISPPPPFSFLDSVEAGTDPRLPTSNWSIVRRGERVGADARLVGVRLVLAIRNGDRRVVLKEGGKHVGCSILRSDMEVAGAVNCPHQRVATDRDGDVRTG